MERLARRLSAYGPSARPAMYKFDDWTSPQPTAGSQHQSRAVLHTQGQVVTYHLSSRPSTSPLTSPRPSNTLTGLGGRPHWLTMSLTNDEQLANDISDFDIDQLLQLPPANTALSADAQGWGRQEDCVPVPQVCSAHPGDVKYVTNARHIEHGLTLLAAYAMV